MPSTPPFRLAFVRGPLLFGLPVLLGLALAAPPRSSADDSITEGASAEPYVVYVAQAEAFARCGPSGDHYRTDPLRHGQRLEVYVETADGWLGIRPPDESFSWIPADAIELAGDGDSGTVIEDRTVSWIGTHLGRARRYRWQVQLAEGEPVTVLGRSERDGPDGPQLWFRVVPPSGEFRWIHQDQIVDSAEQLVSLARLDATQRSEAESAVEFLPGSKRNSPEQRNLPDRSVASNDQDRQQDRPSDFEQDLESRSQPALDRVAADQSPTHRSPDGRPLPSPVRQTAAVSQESPVPASLARGTEELPTALERENPQVIGSGLRSDWRNGSQRKNESKSMGESPGVESLSTAAFTSRPRLQEIGAGEVPPSSDLQPDDGNWVSGTARSAPSDLRPSGSEVRQASGRGEMPRPRSSDSGGDPLATDSRARDGLARDGSLMPGSAPLLRALRTVSSEAIAAVEEETRGASVERLQLVFSRLMADRASSAEVAPVLRAAKELESNAGDDVVAGRARLLAERVERYQQISQRRDGDSVVRTSAAPVLPQRSSGSAVVDPGMVVQAIVPSESPRAENVSGDPKSGDSPANASSAEGGEVMETGVLAALYSVRKQSPPYVLIDRSGETIAYVSPAPGVDLQRHLNSRIRVSGKSSYLEGINTPHLLVSRAERTPES